MITKLDLITTPYGFNFWTNSDDKSPFNDQIRKVNAYERGTCHVLNTILRNGDLFIDIGAHYGFLSMVASSMVGPNGKVYSFEPNQDSFELLKINAYNTQFANIHPACYAISDKPGTATLYIDNESLGDSSLFPTTKAHKLQTTSVLTLTDVFDYIKSDSDPEALPLGRQYIVVVKIDVEGVEDKVISGGKRLFSSDDSPIIIYEHNIHTGANPLNIQQLITELNNEYIFFKLERNKSHVGKLVPIYVWPEHDNIFCFLPHHMDLIPKSLF